MKPAKILVDECLSRPAIKALVDFADIGETDVIIEHQLDVYGQGADDRVWVPKAAKDGWTIVTADRGTHSRVEAKLPLLCEAALVTHVLMSGGLSKRRMAFKVLKIQENLGEIIAAARSETIARYSLRLTGQHSSKLERLKIMRDHRQKHQQSLLSDVDQRPPLTL